MSALKRIYKPTEWLEMQKDLGIYRLANTNKWQSDIARELGVSQQTVSRWENGSMYTPPDRLHEWALLLGLKITIRLAK
jgi:transcriptional regulator with XRE-family HTH domain